MENVASVFMIILCLTTHRLYAEFVQRMTTFKDLIKVYNFDCLYSWDVSLTFSLVLRKHVMTPKYTSRGAMSFLSLRGVRHS